MARGHVGLGSRIAESRARAMAAENGAIAKASLGGIGLESGEYEKRRLLRRRRV
jgi:hypothetical protein